MVIQYKEIVSVITKLGDEENLRVTVKHSAMGGLIAGFICFLGGLIAGPIGFVFGGAAGGVVASYFSYDSFKPLSTTIKEMRPEYQRAMVISISKIFENVDAMDALEVLALIKGSTELKAKVVGELKSFCQDQLSLQLSTF